MDDPKEKTNTVYRFVPLYTVHHIVLKKDTWFPYDYSNREFPRASAQRQSILQ